MISSGTIKTLKLEDLQTWSWKLGRETRIDFISNSQNTDLNVYSLGKVFSFHISVLVIPDKIYPCFQHIGHCFMMLTSLSLNPAKLSLGPLSLYYPECKCLNQCFHCSLWDLPLFTTHMTLLDDAYITYPQPSQIVPWLSEFSLPLFSTHMTFLHDANGI